MEKASRLTVSPGINIAVGSALQSAAGLLICLRLLKVLYVLPQTGLMLLMTLRMINDLRPFLILLSGVFFSFVSSLYIWSAFWAPMPNHP